MTQTLAMHELPSRNGDGAPTVKTGAYTGPDRRRTPDSLDQLRCRLHDGTLQILELMASGGPHRDLGADEMRSLAAMAAADLRELLESPVAGGACELEECLRGAVRDARYLAPHEIHLALGPIDDSVRDEEASAIVEAVREALNNARKHARAATVTIYAEAVGGEALVTIKDDGVGVDLDHVEAGIGLRHSIAGRMARLGGDATVESSPGSGMLVTLSLPRREARAA